MNTANLQLGGLLMAVSSLLEAMKRKGLMTQQEIEEALDSAEATISGAVDLRAANIEAIHFPIRFLRVAMNAAEGSRLSFSEIATTVGETKPSR